MGCLESKDAYASPFDQTAEASGEKTVVEPMPVTVVTKEVKDAENKNNQKSSFAAKSEGPKSSESLISTAPSSANDQAAASSTSYGAFEENRDSKVSQGFSQGSEGGKEGKKGKGKGKGKKGKNNKNNKGKGKSNKGYDQGQYMQQAAW